MSGFSSKYRHIYGDSAKGKDQYSDIKNCLTSGESSYIKANPRFWAYGKGSGGAPVYIHKLTDVGRTGSKGFYISTHKGRLVDFDFHPFIDTLIATAADDCKININKFPVDGMTENIKSAEISCKGHKKKISLISFNPSANNILASASYDRTIKIWNIENAACVASMDAKESIYSVAWNKDGSQIASTSKDKVLRLWDPRSPDASSSIVGAFGGIKSTKCFFVNAFGWVGATGFGKTAKRELKLWDVRNTEKPVYNKSIDAAASVLLPHMDNDLNVLYLAGKGDNSLSYYELRNDDKICHYLSLYRDGIPQKGGGWVPKRGLSVMKCEVQRFLKLTKDSVVPISFIVPRKSGGDVFQEDIFPQCASSKPGLSADEWSAGNNSEPKTMSMDPDDRKDEDQGDVTWVKRKTYEEVVAENMELLKKVKVLEDEVASLKAQSGGGAVVNDEEAKEMDVEKAADDE